MHTPQMSEYSANAGYATAEDGEEGITRRFGGHRERVGGDDDDDKSDGVTINGRDPERNSSDSSSS